MSNLLAGIYSKADSLKRALNNAFSEPLLYAQQAVGYGIDRLNEQTADMLTAESKSVLLPPEQKAAARERSVDRMANTVAGAGIIVPIGAVPGMTRRVSIETTDLLRRNPTAAFINEGVFRQNLTGQAVKNISDKGQLIKGEHVTVLPNGLVRLKAGNEGRMTPYKLGELVDLERYPPDLAEYLKSITVAPTPGPGASYSQSGRMTLGTAESSMDLTSNLLHEMQHGSQYLYDMPRGGSPVSFYGDYGRFSTAKMRGEQLLAGLAREGKKPVGDIQAFSSAKGPSDILSNPDAINSVLGMLTKVEKQAHSNYENIAGEAEARLVQRLFSRNDIGIPSAILENRMGVNPANIINPESVPLMPKVDADPVTQSLIKMLLGE